MKLYAIDGMGPEAPEEVTAAGGRHSKIPYRFDLIDARALFALAQTMQGGSEKYGEDNWRSIPIDAHLNHAIAHIYAFMAGDNKDSHLTHALARVHMAVALDLEVEE